MENRRDARLDRLVQALKSTDKIHLKDASRLLNVSEMTIRRDLSDSASGVVLLGGYVVNNLRSDQNRYFVSAQEEQNVARKRRLGHLAAALIEPGDRVFFDCGTTMPWVIDAIDPRLEFTAICCSMNSFLALNEKPACHIILAGGEYHSDNALFTALGSPSLPGSFCPEKAFISAAGIDAVQGATCYNVIELPLKHQAMHRTTRKILLADSSKFGKVLPARIGGLDAFDTLVSDCPPPPLLSETLVQNGVKFIGNIATEK